MDTMARESSQASPVIRRLSLPSATCSEAQLQYPLPAGGSAYGKGCRAIASTTTNFSCLPYSTANKLQKKFGAANATSFSVDTCSAAARGGDDTADVPDEMLCDPTARGACTSSIPFGFSSGQLCQFSPISDPPAAAQAALAVASTSGSLSECLAAVAPRKSEIDSLGTKNPEESVNFRSDMEQPLSGGDDPVQPPESHFVVKHPNECPQNSASGEDPRTTNPTLGVVGLGVQMLRSHFGFTSSEGSAFWVGPKTVP
ncbi:UNVERIFIED_CONTAM: hypothetical protein HHA_451940 [Hammondia hammondi]|eukprot:XP_008884940.1 hypothetical protein HHA_451940 [Hammondia hammondi]